MRFYILGILSILTMLYGCDRDEDHQESGTKGIQQVRFVVNPETYATDTRFEEGDLIGIYAVKQGTDLKASGNFADNKQYRFDGKSLLPFSENDKILYMHADKLEFYAYYPYQENVEDATQLHFNAAEGQADNPSQSDLLWASNITGIMNNAISLNFTHMLALVEVKFNSVSGKKPTFAQLYSKSPSVLLNLKTGNITEKSAEKQLNNMNLYHSSGNSYTYRYIVPCQDIIKGDTLFIFNVEGCKRIFKAVEDLSLKSSVKNQFECALQYRIDTNTEGEGNVFGNGIYNYGEPVKVLGIANSGYKFVGWYENGELVCDQLVFEFTAEKDRSLICKFEFDNIREIIVSSSGGGSTDGGGVYIIDEECTVKATAYPSYYFQGWYEKGSLVSQEKEYSFGVLSNRVLEALFLPYNVFVEVKFYGLGFGVNGSGPIAYGSAKVDAYYIQDGVKKSYSPGNEFSLYISFGYTAAHATTGSDMGYMICSNLQLKVNAFSGDNIFRLFYWDKALVSPHRMSDLNTILNMRLDRSSDQSTRVYTFIDTTVGFYREDPWSGLEENYSLIKLLANQRDSNY